jgi:hypothetical protein
VREGRYVFYAQNSVVFTEYYSVLILYNDDTNIGEVRRIKEAKYGTNHQLGSPSRYSASQIS